MMIDSSMKRPARSMALIVILSLALLLVVSFLADGPAATFTDNRTGNAPDANINNAACDSNASQAGNQCTLRAAIQEANDTGGADLIRFNIQSSANVKTISPLPTIKEEVTINGYSQPGASPTWPLSKETLE